MSRATPKETYSLKEVQLIKGFRHTEDNARRLSSEIEFQLLRYFEPSLSSYREALEQARGLLRDVSDNAMNERLAIEYEYPQDVDSDR